MNKLEIINVGNGSNKYPGNFTKKESEIIQENIIGHSLHLFSGRSKIGDVRIDFSCNESTIQGDVFEFLEYNYTKFDTIILDPPYNARFTKKYRSLDERNKNQFCIFTGNLKKNRILFDSLRKIAPKRIILKSWNYYIIKDYFFEKGYLCYSGGYRKSTILLIMDKIDPRYKGYDKVKSKQTKL